MIMSILAIAMYGMKLIMGNTAMDVLKEAGSGGMQLSFMSYSAPVGWHLACNSTFFSKLKAIFD